MSNIAKNFGGKFMRRQSGFQAGRKLARVKAKFITITVNNIEFFYELDQKGRLIIDPSDRVRIKPIVHHVKQLELPPEIIRDIETVTVNQN